MPCRSVGLSRLRRSPGRCRPWPRALVAQRSHQPGSKQRSMCRWPTGGGPGAVPAPATRPTSSRSHHQTAATRSGAANSPGRRADAAPASARPPGNVQIGGRRRVLVGACEPKMPGSGVMCDSLLQARLSEGRASGAQQADCGRVGVQAEHAVPRLSHACRVRGTKPPAADDAYPHLPASFAEKGTAGTCE